MRKILFVPVLALHWIIFTAFIPPSGTNALVATDNYKSYIISIYKNTDTKTPYSISIAGKCQKELSIIGYDDDLFKFVLVEKTATDLIYYPFAWLEASNITVADLKDDCRKILDKQVNPIEKKQIKQN